MQERYRKIAMVGTSNIGKSSIMTAMREGGVTGIPEAARDYFQAVKPDDPFSFQCQSVVQSIALHREYKAHHQNPEGVFLTDRSVLDVVIYLKAIGDEDGSKKLLERVQFWLPTYKRFLILDPKEVPYQKDEVRKEDEELRMKFHEAFIEFFEQSNLPYEIITGTLEERLQKVKKALEE